MKHRLGALSRGDPSASICCTQNREKTRRFTAFVSSALDQHLILREIQTYDVAGEEVVTDKTGKFCSNLIGTITGLSAFAKPDEK